MPVPLRIPSPGSALDAALAATRLQGRAALLGYLPVGFPYSDPSMDGIPIQQANAAALRAGTRVAHAFTAVRAVAAAGGTAVVMTYWPLVDRYGPARFAVDLAAAGGCGLIVPDLPVEEAGPWQDQARPLGLHTVSVVAPNSSDARLRQVCAATSGFIYAPASRSTTGGRGPLDTGLPGFVARLRAVTSVPVCLGIGVHDARSATEAAALADGVIVGSAFVRRLLAEPSPTGVAAVADLAAELRAAVASAALRPPRILRPDRPAARVPLLAAG